MVNLRYPWSVEEPPRCPTCGDAGWLPSPFPANPFDYVCCPACHQDCRWTTADALDFVLVVVRVYDPNRN
jgi:hypothetical protein